ncbi:ABC transporter substrate-binding protein [Natronosalvus halobius]|uniref:ABC transporter substrate-binding protein n=1 Tax=Natronosalvus halobius TaxID=2953746 RepID=UPI0020A0C684|nr:PotD/PotF family extracellular solute-binding protein [Natronosalvus halobius]USZ73711.1 PotD/PotF family extracellular solute-binding protein [Natronosalvus halobius]
MSKFTDGVLASSRGDRSGSSRRRFVQSVGLAGTAALAGCLGGSEGGSTINVLTWEGYGTDTIIDEFESEHDATVNISLLSSDSEGFNMLQSGGTSDYDLLTLNNTWAARHAEAGTIEPLDPDDFPEMDNFLEQFQWPFDSFAYDDEMYALPTRWGWDTLTVNTDEVPEEHYESYEVLWTGGPDGQYKGKMGIMDWPTWNIPKIAQSLGYDPFKQTEEELDDIQDHLIRMFENMGSIYSGTSAIRQAFLQEDIVISPVGNFTMSELRAEGHDWVNVVLPEQGGMQWTEGMCLVEDPSNRELAIEFMNRIISPEGQHSVAWDPAAKSPPVNTESFDLFDADQQEALMFHEDGFDAAETISQQTTPYEFAEDTELWTEMWEEAKADGGI